MVLYQVIMMPPRGASPLRYYDATVRNLAVKGVMWITSHRARLNTFQNGPGRQVGSL